MAVQNLGRVGIVLKGAWSGLTDYVELDLVSYDGNSWVAKRSNKNVEPTTEHSDDWQLISNNADLVATVQGYKNDAAASATAADSSASSAAASAAKGQEAQDMIAPTEASATASMAHAAGNYFILGGVLYQATADIASGDTIVTSGTGANCQTVPDGLGGDVSALKSAIDEISSSNKNLWEGAASLSFTTSESVTLPTPLPAGTYTLSALITSSDTDATKCRFAINGSSPTKDLSRETRSSGTVTVDSQITRITFFASTNSTKSKNDTATWGNIQIESGSSATSYVPHQLMAKDEIARAQIETTRSQISKMVKFVAATGSDSNSGDSPSAPYATLGKALTEGADIIYVNHGTYTENFSGEENTYYRYRGVRIICDNATIVSSSFGLQFRYSDVHITGLTIDLTNSSSSLSYGFLMANCTGTLTDCSVFGALGAGGFRLDGAKMTLTRCVAHDCAVDGFNAHTQNTGYDADCTFYDCVAYNNADDGLSFHEHAHIRVFGGEFYANGSTGLAPHQYCNFEIRNACIHGNGAGIECFNPSYSSGDTKGNGIIIGCIILDNNLVATGHASANIGYGVHAQYYNVKALANCVSGNNAGAYFADTEATIDVCAITAGS